MRNNTTLHVEPITFWQCACGGIDLSKRDYLHLIACTDCETFADEITDALDDIEKTLGRRYPTSTVCSFVADMYHLLVRRET
jgi:hypothetical protein